MSGSVSGVCFLCPGVCWECVFCVRECVGSVFFVSGSVFLVSGSVFLVSGSVFLVSGSVFLDGMVFLCGVNCLRCGFRTKVQGFSQPRSCCIRFFRAHTPNQCICEVTVCWLLIKLDEPLFTYIDKFTMYVHLYIHTRIHINIYIYISACIHIHIHMYIYIYTYQRCRNTCVYRYVHECTCTATYDCGNNLVASMLQMCMYEFRCFEPMSSSSTQLH